MHETLRAARHVVVQDYPDRDIPDSLTRAGFAVTIYGGPDPADIVVSELVDGAIVHRQTGRRPDRADLLYVYRPLAEIDGILTDAQRLGVRTIWRQPDVGGGPIRTPTHGVPRSRRRASPTSTRPPSTTWRGC